MANDLINRPVRGIAVDAGTSGNPGITFYKGVDIFTGKVLFSENIGMATNNIGEFLALCHAIHYCLKNNVKSVIYTDSVTALSWLKKEKTNSSFKENPLILERLKKSEQFLKSIPLKDTLVIEKWLTEDWGEIPADFGRK